jgi:hypothetical protein
MNGAGDGAGACAGLSGAMGHPRLAAGSRGDWKRAVFVGTWVHGEVSDSGSNRIEKFGALPTPVHASSWGALKARYR